MKLQKTIKYESQLKGRGLFGGKNADVLFRPAPTNSGIVFIRTDLPESVRIDAIAPNVAQRTRRTTLKKGSVSIETVEHCLAAVRALAIDNIIIEIAGPEMPAPDCSSAAYYKILKRAKPVEQDQKSEEFVITNPVTITEADTSIYALPYDDEELNITYDLDYGRDSGIDRQIYSFRLSCESFEKELAPARTFLLEAEAKQFQSRGIGKHIKPQDLLVINSKGPIDNKYRFENECVRHKILDLIGDLVLVGRPIHGRIVAYKSGHSLNQQLVKKLYQAAQQQLRFRQYGTDAILDIRQISKILPHRYPFLLVDRVIEIESDTYIKAIKNVTFNEQFFQGHFPSTPIMPGVLIVEALAQVSGLLFAQKLEHTGKLAVLLSMDNVKLRKPVVPGDQLVLESQTVRMRKRTAQCKCRASVCNATTAEAQIKFMLVDDEKL